MLKIWTDGSCLGNPGPGGWGFIATDGKNIAERNGGEANTTNNRMELMAVIRALTAAKRHDAVEIHTDSQYVKTACKHGWRIGKRTIGVHPRKSLLRIKICGNNWMKSHQAKRYIGSGSRVMPAKK